jgi:predicted DNA-binding helix-hairpin-helix protein
LLRIPGLGQRTVDRIIAARRHRTLRLDDLARLSGAIRRAWPFVIAADHRPRAEQSSERLRAALMPSPQQLSLFA